MNPLRIIAGLLAFVAAPAACIGGGCTEATGWGAAIIVLVFAGMLHSRGKNL